MLQRPLFPALLLVLAVFAAYSNCFSNSFLYDDEFLIQKNESIRDWSGLTKSFLTSTTGGSGGHDSFYRPIQGALYTVVFQMAGPSPFAFHFLNVFLHAMNAILLFYLGGRLGFSKLASWLAAFLWCLHPLHTEAVTYQSATADPLYACFILSGLLLWAPEFNWRRLPLAATFYLLALLSKETAIVFPALAVACLFLLRSGRWNWRSYTVTGPLWAMAGLYLLARKTVLNFDNTFQFYKTANIYTEHILYRFFTFLATLPSYFGLLLWPQHLHMDREFPVFVDMASLAVLLGAALLAAGVAALWWERRSTRPIVSFAVLWFLAAHVPHSGVLLPVNSMFLEHWLYLPSVGFFLSFGETATTWSLGRRIAFPLALAIAAIFGVVTFRQNRIWRTPVSFYSNILKYETKVARVHNNLAMAFSDEGDNDGAIVEYEKAIEISDTYPQSHHNLGLALIRKGDVDGAIRHLKRALELDPDFYYSSGILAQIYHQMGNDPQADEYSRRYVESIQKFRH